MAQIWFNCYFLVNLTIYHVPLSANSFPLVIDRNSILPINLIRNYSMRNLGNTFLFSLWQTDVLNNNLLLWKSPAETWRKTTNKLISVRKLMGTKYFKRKIMYCLSFMQCKVQIPKALKGTMHHFKKTVVLNSTFIL